MMRSPAELMTLAGRGEAISDLTPEEDASLKKHARSACWRFENEICNRLQKNDLRAARHKLHKMLANPSVRLHALLTVEAARPSDERRTTPLLLSRVGQVDVFQRTASPLLFWKEKPEGGRRPICKFGPEDKACGKLIGLALSVFARAHPRLACHPAQALLFGGSSAACERLRDALQAVPDGAVFVQIDVKAFYGAIKAATLAQITGLPPEVIHRHLSCSHMRVRLRDGDAIPGGELPGTQSSAPNGDGCSPNEAIPGICQGSAASPPAAEMVMGKILRDADALERTLFITTISDNVGFLVPTREAALAVSEALRVVIEGHEAGSFHIHRPIIREVADGFSFLGYQWRRSPRGKVAISASPARFYRWKMEFWDRVGMAMMSEDPCDILAFRQVVGGFAASKKLWQGAEHFRKNVELRLIEYFSQRCQALALDPLALMVPGDHSLLNEAADAAARERSRREARLRNAAPQRAGRGPWGLKTMRQSHEPLGCGDTASQD